MRVPCPGFDSMVKLPLIMAIRSRMPSNPNPRGVLAGMSAGLKPRPSSVIFKLITPLARCSETDTFWAAACRAMLLKASCPTR